MSLDDSKLYYVHRYKTTNEIWDTLEMVYRALLNTEEEKMNTRDEKDEHINP